MLLRVTISELEAAASKLEAAVADFESATASTKAAADAAKAEEVAQMMLDNIDPVKWICVQADDIDAAIYGDLVLFVMIGSQFGIPAADMIGAFKTVTGGVLDKELSK